MLLLLLKLVSPLLSKPHLGASEWAPHNKSRQSSEFVLEAGTNRRGVCRNHADFEYRPKQKNMKSFVKLFTKFLVVIYGQTRIKLNCQYGSDNYKRTALITKDVRLSSLYRSDNYKRTAFVLIHF